MTTAREPLEQGTAAWKAWKHRRIGGTAAAVICCDGTPWTTPYEEWTYLTGRSERPVHPGMVRGQTMEADIRRLYQALTGVDLVPAVVVHPAHDWAIASLDGRTADGVGLVEIKAPGREAHDAIVRTGIPPYYRAQCDHYLWVTGAAWCDFVSYHPDAVTALWIRRVDRDPTRLTAHAARLTGWYTRHILEDAPPPKTERDWIMRDDESWVTAATLYREAEAAASEWDAKRKAARELLLSLLNGAAKVQGGGVAVTRFERRDMDWGGLVEAAAAAGIDPETYRKPPSVQYRVTVAKA